MDSPAPSDAQTAAEQAFDRAFALKTPEQIGGYRVLRLIGQGGMGAVYEAEQQQPKRKVALKVIRPGLLSRSMLRRFGFEVEMLGRLQHPGIARIYEAGAAETELGLQPYFAMEFVAGKPLLNHAQELDCPAKLQLLARIADAVHYAHQNGIIHRDLKPDNILVDEHGQPKVLDFGVARSTNQDAAATMQTETGAIVGTLSYMSPEQAAGEVHQVDVRSDVYALGVIAYQLLAGRLPYVLPRESLITALRLIRELDPQPIGAIHKTLRGDVETILAKALEKARERRYQSAHDLAADIRRHLNDEPISARPADTFYHLGKFVRRNKVLVGGVAATFLVLLIGLAATTWFWRDAVAQRQLAEAHEQEAQRRLVRSLVAQGDALALAGRWQDAKARHLQAIDDARRIDLNESTLPALFGFWEDRRHSPEALAVWKTHPAPSFVTLSPDARLAMSGGGLLRVWDVGRGVKLLEHSYTDFRGATAGAFSNDGSLLAIGSGTGTVALWDLKAGRGRWRTQAHDGPVKALAFVERDDGPAILSVATATADSLALVRVEDGIVARRFGDEAGQGQSPSAQPGIEAGHAAISTDGQLAAVAHRNGLVRIWRVETGELHREFVASSGNHGVAFLPDSSRIMVASADKTLGLWDAIEARQVAVFEGHANGVASVVISRDGSRMLSGSWDTTVRLWDIATGAQLRVFTGHQAVANTLAFGDEAEIALSGSGDGTMRVWSLRPEQQVLALQTYEAGTPLNEVPHVVSVSLSADGRLVAASDIRGMLHVWDAATGLLLRRVQAHEAGDTSLGFLPDSQRLLTSGAGGVLRLWNVADPGNEPLMTMQTGDSRIRSIAVSPDGKRVLCGGDSGIVEEWDLETARQINRLEAGSRVHSVTYTTDGSRALLALEDSRLELHDLSGARTVAQISRAGGFQDVNAGRQQPGEGKLIAAGGWSGVPRLWDAAPPHHNPQPGFLPEGGHGSTLMTLDFTSDGRFLITGGWDNTVRLWDVERRTLIRALTDHERPVLGVAASADGKYIASASWDGTARLWEIQSVTDFFAQRDLADAALQSLSRQPQDSAALHVLANWYARRGAQVMALRMYAEAAGEGVRISHLQLARCYVALGRWEQARLEYERARAASEAPAHYINLCLGAISGSLGEIGTVRSSHGD